MGSSDADVDVNVHSIAIIGAGPSGLAAAKYLSAEEQFTKIVVYEQRSNVGGLWNHCPCDDAIRAALPVPQTNPHVGLEEPIPRMASTSSELVFMSPVYDRLETNIPRGLMGFKDLNWPEGCQLFPKHEDVLEYIEQYAADVRHLIKFEMQVVNVEPLADKRWRIHSRKIDGTDEYENFDGVVVANGHFNVPYIPPVEGIEAWHKAYPGSISHSKFFRRPEDYAGKKVVVVGNAASGIDIGAQIRQTCKAPLIQSSVSESYLSPGPSVDQMEKPRIASFETSCRTVRFEDGSLETDVDTVLYCTGYLYSYPFLESLEPPIISSGERVEKLFKHIFYRPNPTLTFVGLNQKVIPFPVGEAQAAVIAGVYTQRLSLPPPSVMERWEEDVLADSPRIRDFHLLKFPKDGDYINSLHDWSAAKMANSTSKIPPYWSKQDYWVREQFPAIKKAFQGLGERRHNVRTLADVGFVFDS